METGVVSALEFQQARQEALDSDAPAAARITAIRRLAALRTREAAGVLIDLASRPAEDRDVLRASGAAMAELSGDGLVTNWDIRDLTESAAEAFYE